MKPKKIIVMGVSGCGKSLIGSTLATALGLRFFDGDDFHSPDNVRKMSEGVPLNDEDRAEWLARLNQLLRDAPNAVLACSALKPEYRRQLRAGIDGLEIVYLQGDFDTIWNRHQQRADHYFNGRAMLESQFATLVEPEQDEALFIDIRQSQHEVLQDILTRLSPA
ncbi:gluconokinase [Photobacterium sp. WH77]|uniref:Gluconokinase n=1 Tax=Photobacterium arenosum TaxID=2774143 RepID=A0ABR9BK41_9GAMM|nr:MULTISPECIES: gluconokinase [Photobacterium]MBD8512726.1 gluconokinase [Photobacterium arenosum]MBV7261185.1 gluconokinase [Photobacterium sp. WH24]MCG2835381.1 gluconokinase [Photobacterium sp. WH77]MCG2842994.1 gluconokinase [Photobacterium sp. WH80]MDO6580319.1 gluconokinase [Photobacterium sp. 2_MG-2023]